VTQQRTQGESSVGDVTAERSGNDGVLGDGETLAVGLDQQQRFLASSGDARVAWLFSRPPLARPDVRGRRFNAT
jgi:hypothetical protein